MGVPIGTSRFFRMCHRVPGHREPLVHQRHSGLQELSDAGHGSDIQHHDPHTGMPCAPGDGAAAGIVNEDILGALGVTGFQHADTDARIFFRFPLHQVNGRRFIVLDADQTLRNSKPLQAGVDAVQYRVRMLQKLPVVCRFCNYS